MDPELVSKHYKGRQQLLTLQHEHEKRDHYVCCVVLGLKLLASLGPNLKSVMDLQHDFDVKSLKLKLEYSAKSSFQEAKIDTLKDENTKLKAKLLTLEKAAASASSRPSSILKSLTTSRGSSDILISNGQTRKGLFTPTKPLASVSAADDPFSLSARARNIFGTSSRRPLLDDASLISSTPFKRLPEAGFSDNSNTDTHSPTSETLLRRSRSGSSTADEQNDSTDEEPFASAESAISNTSTASVDRKKRRRKLQLRNASRVNLPVQSKTTGNLGLDDEEINTLNYYQDDNFQVNNATDASLILPPPSSDISTGQKRKKTFSIE